MDETKAQGSFVLLSFESWCVRISGFSSFFVTYAPVFIRNIIEATFSP